MKLLWIRAFLVLLPALVILWLWQNTTSSDPRLRFLLGSPGDVWERLTEQAASGQLFRHLAVTLCEATAGLAIGVGVGTALGLALWKSPTLRWCARPYLMAFGAVPMVALGPVLIFWMGTGLNAKILIAAFCTAPVAFAQAETGVQRANYELLEMAKAFGVPQAKVFWRLVVPSALLWIMASLRLNVGLALLGAFSGEFLASREGLGHLIIVAEGLYDINGMWVGIIGIIFAALTLHVVATPLERWARRYTNNHTET